MATQVQQFKRVEVATTVRKQLNVYRKEENAASLALKFLKAGCQNIHQKRKRKEKEHLSHSVPFPIRLTRLPKLPVKAFTDKQIQTAFQ